MRIVLILAFLTSATACSGSAPRGVFQRSVGTASSTDLVERAGRVLTLFQYELEREEVDARLVTLQTRWKRRVAFGDEEALGIAAGETRITVTGRLRSETDLGSLYAVDLSIENRVLLQGAGTWSGDHATPMYVAYADSLARQLQRELTIGVRRFDR